MTLHQRLLLHLLFPTLNHFLSPPYHHLIVDHLIETELMGIINNQLHRKYSNEDIDTPTPQDISNAFAAADLSSQSSYDTVKYKRSWHRAKGIRSSILSYG